MSNKLDLLGVILRVELNFVKKISTCAADYSGEGIDDCLSYVLIIGLVPQRCTTVFPKKAE